MKGLGNVRPTSVETVSRPTPELGTSGIRARRSLLSELLVCHPCDAMSVDFFFFLQNYGLLAMYSLT